MGILVALTAPWPKFYVERNDPRTRDKKDGCAAAVTAIRNAQGTKEQTNSVV